MIDYPPIQPSNDAPKGQFDVHRRSTEDLPLFSDLTPFEKKSISSFGATHHAGRAGGLESWDVTAYAHGTPVASEPFNFQGSFLQNGIVRANQVLSAEGLQIGSRWTPAKHGTGWVATAQR